MITTLASIGKSEVVTTRAVHIDALTESLLYKQPALKNVLKSKMDSKTLKSELNRYLIERIIYMESQSFNQVSLSDKEVSAALAQIKSAVRKNKELLELWGFLTLTDDETKVFLKQKLTAKKFIEFKNKSSEILATDAEAFSYYQNNKIKFKGIPFAELKENIKKEISRDQAEQRLEDWIDILKKKFEVTFITPV